MDGMTDFNKWDKKATALVAEDEEETKAEEAASNSALGIDPNRAEGPPVVAAQAQMAELGEHSQRRQEFIDWTNSREVKLTHSKPEDGKVVQLSGADVQNKAVRLSGSEDVHYVVPVGSSLVKLMLDKCKNVKLTVEAGLITSTLDLCRCENLDVELQHPVGTIQADECTGAPVRVTFADRDHVGQIYHQNTPSLEVGWAGTDLVNIGLDGEVQFVSALAPPGREELFVTAPVVRGEGEFPTQLGKPDISGQAAPPELLPREAPELPEEERKLLSEEKRQQGNEMFRANDFMQAAMQYTEALQLDPTASAIWANRSVCWLKLGDHAKALDDAIKCTEVDPKNPKGWFRKGMALHAMQRYPEAVPALVEAEKLEPSNKQVQDAIKMAQLKARQQAMSS